MLDDGFVVNVGGVDFSMIIDLGVSCNIMGMLLWNSLKDKCIECVLFKVDK